MIPSLLAWLLNGFLLFSCLSLAYSAWKQEVRLSGRSRTSLLVGALEAASFAGLMRLVVPWSPGPLALWVLAAAALAVAVAGLIIRWDELPVRSRDLHAPPSGAPAPVTAAEPDIETGRLRTKSRKKTKKEPGPATVAGYAGFLAAVVVLSLIIG